MESDFMSTIQTVTHKKVHKHTSIIRSHCIIRIVLEKINSLMSWRGKKPHFETYQGIFYVFLPLFIYYDIYHSLYHISLLVGIFIFRTLKRRVLCWLNYTNSTVLLRPSWYCLTQCIFNILKWLIITLKW